MLSEFKDSLEKQGPWELDLENAVIRGSVVLNAGEAHLASAKAEPSPQAAKPKEKEEEKEKPQEVEAPPQKGFSWVSILVGFAFGFIDECDSVFVQHFSVFILSCFIGWRSFGMSLTPCIHPS